MYKSLDTKVHTEFEVLIDTSRKVNSECGCKEVWLG